MSQQNPLELARQGNPDAIAALLNRNLNSKGITSKVSRRNNCLRIMLESSEVPSQDNLVGFIRNGILKLSIADINTLQIFGRQTGDDVPAWSQIVDLNIQKSSSSTNQQPPSNASQHVEEQSVPQQQEPNFKVKHNGQELVVSSIDELRRWIADGRVNLTDYAYNPMLDKWMYVRELAEVEDIVKKQESTTQANQYNNMSFVFAGLGLFMLLIYPLAGAVLLIIGIVFSAMYYTRKS